MSCRPTKHLVTRLVILPLPLKPSFDDLQQGSVCHFCLTVCLRVGRRGVMILDSEVLIEIPEKCIIKLSSIV